MSAPSLRKACLRFLFQGALVICSMACALPDTIKAAPPSSGCQISDLNSVFRNPAAHKGQTFCGEVVGVPQRTGIVFFPLHYDYAAQFYETALFVDDQHVVDRLRLSREAPFRIHLEGRIGLLEECFSEAAARGQLACEPTRHPITLTVSRVGAPTLNNPH